MGDPKEWARSLGKEIEASESRSVSALKAVATQREVEAIKMPLLWDELCATFDETCKAYNEELHPERPLTLFKTNRHRFEIKPDAMPEIVRASFDASTHRVTITTSFRQHFYDPKFIPVGNGEVAFRSLQTQRQVTLAEIAQAAVKEGLGR